MSLKRENIHLWVRFQKVFFIFLEKSLELTKKFSTFVIA